MALVVESKAVITNARSERAWQPRAEQFIGAGSLRGFTRDKLAALTVPVVIVHRSQPVSVLVPYELFLSWQAAIQALQVEP